MSTQDQMSFLFKKDDDLFLADAKNDDFDKFEAAALTTRAQNMATLSTIANIVAQTSTAPFSLIDPYTKENIWHGGRNHERFASIYQRKKKAGP
jgi:hypothetical protein